MKLSQLLIVGSLMVGSAIPVLATGRDYNRHDRSDSGVKVENKAYIDSSASAMSSTGMNSIEDCGCQTPVRSFRFGGHHNNNNSNNGDNLIGTGVAGSEAYSEVANVNLTDLPAVQNARRSRHSSGSSGLEVDNYARINSTADAMSGSGMNTITGSGNNTIYTGAATSLADSFVHDVNVTGLGL